MSLGLLPVLDHAPPPDQLASALQLASARRDAGRLHSPGEREPRALEHANFAIGRGITDPAALQAFLEHLLLAEGVEPPRAATIAARAASKALCVPAPSGRPSLRPEPVPPEEAARIRASLVAACPPAARKPPPEAAGRPAFEAFLAALYDPGDKVAIKAGLYHGACRRAGEWAREDLPPGSTHILPNPVHSGPSGKRDTPALPDVSGGPLPYCYLECDQPGGEALHLCLLALGLPLVAAVTSGKRSVHCVLRVNAAGLDDWRERVTAVHLALAGPLGLDHATATPTQVMRLPGVSREGAGEQRLVHLDADAAAVTPGMLESAAMRLRKLAGCAARLRVRSAAALLAEPWPRWLVRGLIAERSLVVVYGPSNSGKSFLVLDLACALAQPPPPAGAPAPLLGTGDAALPIDPTPVLYLGLEGSSHLRGRLVALQRAGRWDPEVTRLSVVTDAWNAFRADAATLLCDAIEETGRVWGEPCRLVCVDTLSRTIAGQNESASEVMTRAVEVFDLVRARTGAAVLLVHHAGKDLERGARGHSALRAASDSEEEVTREASGLMTLRTTKARDAVMGGQRHARLRVIEVGIDQFGLPVTSCVIEHIHAPGEDDAPPCDAPPCDAPPGTPRRHTAEPGEVLALLPRPSWEAWRAAAARRGVPGGAFNRMAEGWQSGIDYLVEEDGRVNPGPSWGTYTGIDPLS